MIKAFASFCQRPFIRTVVRGLSWALFSLFTFYCLGCALTNWYGARRMKSVLALVAKEGETVDFRAVLPEPLAEAENFCAIEPLKDLAMDKKKEGLAVEKRKSLEAFKLPQPKDGKRRPSMPSASSGQRTDLATLNQWLRAHNWTLAPEDHGNPARDLLAAFAKQDALFRALSQGLERTKANWTPEWSTRELPKLLFTLSPQHLSGVLSLNSLLALRSIASVRVSDSVIAYESAQIMSRLALASSHDPFLISTLLTFIIEKLLCGVIWEMCDAEAGSAADFLAMEKTLSEIDPQRVMLAGARSEIPLMVNALKVFHPIESDMVRGVFGDRFPRWQLLLMRAIPRGVFEATGAFAVELELKEMILPLRDEGLQPALQKCVRANAILESNGSLLTRPLSQVAKLAMPATTGVLRQAVYVKAIMDQARIACALERHRIVEGGYPDSLDSLKMADVSSPPSDVVDGKPMHYRKTQNAKYALWSVGFDSEDNNGVRGASGDKGDKGEHADPAADPAKEGYLGDWVWDFPSK